MLSVQGHRSSWISSKEVVLDSAGAHPLDPRTGYSSNVPSTVLTFVSERVVGEVLSKHKRTLQVTAFFSTKANFYKLSLLQSPLNRMITSHSLAIWFDTAELKYNFLLFAVTCLWRCHKEANVYLNHLLLVGTSYFSVFWLQYLSQCTFHYSWHEDVIFVF